MPKVSVIVPVYKVEEYLPKCLDSLVNQTLKDIEIILVNDGSPDNSDKIIKKYAKKDDRIVYIEKENGGQASARNMGVKVAKGEFISFVDSDEWIELETLEECYKKAKKEKSDIVQFDLNKVIDGEKHYEPFFTLEGEDLKKTYILNVTSPWGKIIKKEIITDNDLYFPEGIIYEDYAVAPVYGLFAKKISYIDKPFYNYLVREGSTMTQNFNKKFYDIIAATKYLYNLVKKYDKQYYDEFEFTIIRNSFTAAYERLKTSEEGRGILDELSAWAHKTIPKWYKNKYYREYGFKKRLFIYLIYKKQYKLLNFIHNIKK